MTDAPADDPQTPSDDLPPPGDPPTWALIAVAALFGFAALAWLVSWWSRPGADLPEPLPLPDAPGEEFDAALPEPDPGDAPATPTDEEPVVEPEGAIDAESSPFASVDPNEAGWVVVGVGEPRHDDGDTVLDALALLAEQRTQLTVAVRDYRARGVTSARAAAALTRAIPALSPDVVIVTVGAADAASGATSGPYADGLTTSPLFAHWRSGDWETGLAQVDRAPGADRDAWRALFLYQSGDLDAASAVAAPLAGRGQEPGHPLALFVLGMVETRYGRGNRASVPLSLLSRAPRSWFRDVGLGLWSIDQGHQAVVQPLVRNALAATPENPEARWTARRVAEETEDAELAALIADAPPAPPTPWFLAAEARRTGEAPEGLDALDAADPARALVETIVGHRSDTLVGADDVAAKLAQRTDAPRWVAAEALALAIRATPADSQDRPDRERLATSTFADVPLVAFAVVEADWDVAALCARRIAAGTAALEAGYTAAEITARLLDCEDAEALDRLADQHVAGELGSLGRIWPDAVVSVLQTAQSSTPKTAEQVAAAFDAALDAMATLAQETETPLVVLPYAGTGDARRQANELLEAWTREHPDVLAPDLTATDPSAAAEALYPLLEGKGITPPAKSAP